MSNTYSSKPIVSNDMATAKYEPRFSVAMLLIAFTLLICTFPYWLSDPNSSYSLVNALFNKFALSTTIYQQYYIHLAVTILFLVLLLNSGLREWTGWRISNNSEIVNRFKRDSKRTMFYLKLSRVLLAIITCILVYLTMLGVIVESNPPRLETSLVFLFVIVLFLTWDIRPIKPEPILKTESVSARHKMRWITLDKSKKLLAYLMDPKVDEDQWVLTSKDWIDLSFKEAYILDMADLEHEVQEAVLSDNISGALKYYIKIAPNYNHFPEALNSSQIRLLNTNFMSVKSIQTFLFLSIGKDIVGRLDDLWINISQALGRAWNTTNNSNDDIDAQLQDQLNGLNDRIADFASIASECTQIVEQNLRDKFDGADLFTLVFQLKDVSNFKLEIEKLKQFNKERSVARATNNDRKDEKIMDAKIEIATNPTLTVNRIKELDNLKINQSLPVNEKANIKLESEKAPLEIKMASEKLAAILKNAQELARNSGGTLDPKLMLQIISNSTNIFAQQKIEPDDFLQRIKKKLNDEKEQRTDEAIRQLIEDTLVELSSI